MELFRLRDDDQDAFAEAPENGMDLHYAQTRGGDFYLVIGCRVAILLNERTYSEPDTSYLYQPWAGSGLSDEGRIATFERWLSSLRGAPSLITTSAASAAPAFWSAMGMVTPIGTLPPPPPRPASIYGHLPFQVTTGPGALIYRWEAYPTSRRIDRVSYPPTIAADTYAAPASEVPFAPTGFAAVARFALPNLMPACFRYELQPAPGTVLECGASVPLYGQSGGGVEVKFTALTANRCAIADPVVLSAL
jgi:hypothetical protein